MEQGPDIAQATRTGFFRQLLNGRRISMPIDNDVAIKWICVAIATSVFFG
jgi:hypothetical protein